MKRVVIIADCIDTQKAGIQAYTRNMIEALSMLPDIELFCVRIKSQNNDMLKNQIVVKPVLPFLIKDPLRLFFKLPCAIRKLKPDIVIEPAHFGPFNLPKKIKRVTVIHDLTPVKFPHWHNFLSSKLQQVFLPSILKKASLIITNSKNTSKDLVECYPFTSGKIEQVYPAVDPFFQLDKTEITPDKQPFFLNVGTIEPRKNLSVLLDAFTLFKEQTSSNFKLVICGGNGWKNSDFFKKLESHPYRKDIEMKGYVPKEELKELYKNTAAFVYPSLYEGFGFPVAEAMGCGAVCIASNRSSLPEAGGNAAIYFNPESKEELAGKLTEAASLSKKTAEYSIKSLVQSSLFSSQKFALELEKILLAVK